jgi:hypothetical protein
MKIKYGAMVVDRNGQLLGTVDHLAHDGWTGEVTGFMVRRKTPAKDLFLRPADVAEASEAVLRLGFAVNE